MTPLRQLWISLHLVCVLLLCLRIILCLPILFLPVPHLCYLVIPLILLPLLCNYVCFLFGFLLFHSFVLFYSSKLPNALSVWLAEERSVLLSDPLYVHHIHDAHRWKSILEKILACPDDLALATVTESIVSVIQQMKDISKKSFSSPPFRRAIKDSGLTSIFESICNPSFILLNRNSHLLHLEHLYRIADQLAEILDSWTPDFISECWDVSPGHFLSLNRGTKHFQDPKEFFDLFDSNPSNVPGEDNLSFCFFMTSFESFHYNYNRWMAIFLENKDYNLMEFNDVHLLEDFYTRLMSLVHHWCNDFQYTSEGVQKLIIDIKDFRCERWRTIIKKTAWLRTLFHPDSIGISNPISLRGLESDPDIVARCGHQLLLVLDQHCDPSIMNQSVVDWKTAREKKVIDFIWYGSLDDDMLSILQDNVVESTGVQAVKRGGQFQTFSSGKMVPVGSRLPSGGRPGDSYTSYSGLEASTQNGLDILFNQAATSVIMTSTAKLAHPELANDLSLLSADCDRIGMSGANIFNCTGYLAPIHSDNDATRGLCAQALLHADASHNEFSFCNIEYQYYIVTSTNCLWSFHSKNLHGTMLPSALTVRNLNSHAVDPRRVPSTDVPSSSAAISGPPPNPPNPRPGRRPRMLVVAGSQIQQRRSRSASARRPAATVTKPYSRFTECTS
ncbi:hypothetical protein C8R42DRAFT_637972 [Lentinula raphanica]|nr:hypothetical protein C8R42DRAFT_637972 [Lentinula raphanica]